jgi:hypothetical protein
MDSPIVMAILGIVVVIILFFLLRELFCWYWKINSIVDLLEKQNKLLFNIQNQLMKEEEIKKD